MNMKANDMRPGDKIDHDGDTWLVREVMHRTPGNLRAFVQAKIQSLTNGRSKEERFRSTDTVKVADMEGRKMQYLYKEGDLFAFMDSENYEQLSIPGDNIGEAPNYLMENMDVLVQFLNGKPIGVDLPPNVNMTIVETEPGVKGDTVNNVLKPAKTETGFVVNVPISANERHQIKLDTRSAEYLGRVND